FDLGGGTLDISLLRAEGTQIDVLESWAGGEFLGGADFTQSIADWIASEIRGRTGFDPVYHPSAKDKISQAAELIKKELTDRPSTTRKWKKRGFELEINRDTYAGIVEPLMTRSETAIYQAARSAEKQLRGPVKHLLVVGAGSRAHGIREMIDLLDVNRVGSREFPELGQFYVALGAATMAWLKAQNENESNLAGPQGKKTRVFQLRRKTGMNLGIRAWDSDVKDHVLRVILKANTMLPAEKTVSFGKVKTHQSSIRLKVMESPTKQLSDAKSVGEFVVDLDKGHEDQQELAYQSETTFEKDPDREAEVRITLAYDITGQVKVSVLDRRTAKKTSKDLDPEPFDVEVAEASVATDTLAPPPAVAT
ncbi:MAG: Hsp70 family protein, partial [Isosphaeraceae bacterium]